MDDNELMAAVRDRFDPVRMHTRAETIVARGRSLRRRRRGAVAGGALAVALGAGLAVPALTAGTAASPEHVSLAAWTMDQRPDDSISVTLRELRDLPALQRVINAAGARVTIAEQKTFPDDQQKACSVRDWPAYSGVKFEGTGTSVFVLHPAKILPGTVLKITVIPGIKQPPGAPRPLPLTPSDAHAGPRQGNPLSRPAPVGIGYAYPGTAFSVMFTPVRDVASCLSSPAARASSASSSASSPTWTHLAPAAHPTARFDPQLAYDQAAGTVVLFGGYAGNAPTGHYLADTWTWNGTTWTRRHPAASPPARGDAVMTYDAAAGTVVLFGGNGNNGPLDDTWTWNGTTWTRQHPASSPPARGLAVMTYDAATRTAVLFGGQSDQSGQSGQQGSALGDTWTWNGQTWTRQHPAASPPARWQAALAYDSARGTAVLFGGDNNTTYFGDTWTWNGTTWTRRHPAASPSARSSGEAIAYDPATSSVVLFGGNAPGRDLGDTWTWNGQTWVQRHPAASPRARDEAALAYDAATRTVLLFGGFVRPGVPCLVDTWTWG